jgi:predicted CXXCH cytochrome family protein
MKMAKTKRILWSMTAGLVVGLIGMATTVGLATAAPLTQGDQPHAHAFDDPNFQDRWHGLGDPGDCLLCHTTNFQATTGQYSAEGVSCEACHGKVDPNHPPAEVPIRADTDYCGTCHTTTLGEWRLTGHATADVGCTDCHDPHSQRALFEDPDELCLNCHKDSMGPYLEDIHGQKGIGCVDCHELVIPPETPPVDGIVPTGHTFTITPATCVACHTDALHAGFSLPGYENGAKAAKGAITTAEENTVQNTQNKIVQSPEEQIQLLQSQVQMLSASNASRNMTVIFQGGVVGLVLGGSTAWVVSSNIRRGRQEEEDEGEDDEKEE